MEGKEVATGGAVVNNNVAYPRNLVWAISNFLLAIMQLTIFQGRTNKWSPKDQTHYPSLSLSNTQHEEHTELIILPNWTR